MLKNLPNTSHQAVEWLLQHTDPWPESWVLAFVSLVTGAGALWIIKLTTHQRALLRCREKMSATIYEMRLFLDSPRRIVAAQARLVLWSFAYTAQTLPGLLILSLPFSLLFIHLEVRYGYEGYQPKDVLLLQATVDESHRHVPVTLNVSSGVTVQAGPITVPEERKTYFRLEVSEPGDHALVLQIGDRATTKQVMASDGPISLERRQGLWHLISLGTETALDADGPFEQLSLEAPPARDGPLGILWWIWWLIGSTVAALMLRKPFGAVL